MHHQWMPDRLSIEANGISEATLDTLVKMGHEVRMQGRQVNRRWEHDRERNCGYRT